MTRFCRLHNLQVHETDDRFFGAFHPSGQCADQQAELQRPWNGQAERGAQGLRATSSASHADTAGPSRAVDFMSEKIVEKERCECA